MIFFRLFLVLYAAPTLILMLIILGEYAFDQDASGKLFFKRLGLAIVWPFAALSSKGRSVLLNNLSGVK